jgi:hypothetical protein
MMTRLFEYERMNLRLLFAIIFCCWPTVASAQMSGRFYLQKENFAPGEPVFLYFQTTNVGTETQELSAFGSYSWCSGYQIRISCDPDPNLSWEPTITGGSCLSFFMTIDPGESREQRVVLNYKHNIATDGEYEVDAFTTLPNTSSLLDSANGGNLIEVHQHLHFRVDKNTAPDPNAIPSLVAQLKSPDVSEKWEAAIALASIAPQSLQDLFLSFTADTELREWAPLAFYKLNTPRSLQAMADLLRTSEVGSSESLQSAEFLAKTRDPQWYPLLLEFAQKHSNIADYVDYAAESGGEQILPDLIRMLSSTDLETTQPNAISALAYTGSRAAVPVLLELLRSPDPVRSYAALVGLRELTHRTVGGERWFDNPQSQYPKWAQFWAREGSNAPVYKADDLGEGKPLE